MHHLGLFRVQFIPSIGVRSFESLNRHRVETVPECLLTWVRACPCRYWRTWLLQRFPPFRHVVVFVPSVPSRPRDDRCGMVFLGEVRFPLSCLVRELAYLYEHITHRIRCRWQGTHVAHLVTHALHHIVVRRIDDFAKVSTYRLGTHVNTQFIPQAGDKAARTTCRHVAAFSAKLISCGDEV